MFAETSWLTHYVTIHCSNFAVGGTGMITRGWSTRIRLTSSFRKRRYVTRDRDAGEEGISACIRRYQSKPRRPAPNAMTAEPPMHVVELWAASIPGLGRIADHHWLVLRSDLDIDRWEVWQRKDAGGESWGHLHRNLMPPAASVGNGPGRMLVRWTGEDARSLARRIEQSPQNYPWCSRYWIWPGPNSNTYVQWVLQNVHTLSRRGIGRRYYRRASTPQLPPRSP